MFNSKIIDSAILDSIPHWFSWSLFGLVDINQGYTYTISLEEISNCRVGRYKNSWFSHGLHTLCQKPSFSSPLDLDIFGHVSTSYPHPHVHFWCTREPPVDPRQGLLEKSPNSNSNMRSFVYNMETCQLALCMMFFPPTCNSHKKREKLYTMIALKQQRLLPFEWRLRLKRKGKKIW